MTLLLALPLVLYLNQAVLRPAEASTYAAHDAHEGVTIAAEPYDLNQSEKVKTAFGKSDPRESAILPVYVVISNHTREALQFAALSFSFEDPAGRKARHISGEDAQQRMRGGVAFDGRKVKTPKKQTSEVTGQELLVRMLPPGDTVGGFIYLDGAPRTASGSVLYVNGLKWASSGKELFFFEIHFSERQPEKKP